MNMIVIGAGRNVVLTLPCLSLGSPGLMQGGVFLTTFLTGPGFALGLLFVWVVRSCSRERRSACVSVLGASCTSSRSYIPLLASSLGAAKQIEDLRLDRGYCLRQSTEEGAGQGCLWPAEALAVSLSLSPLSTGHWFYYNAALGSRPLMACPPSLFLQPGLFIICHFVYPPPPSPGPHTFLSEH